MVNDRTQTDEIKVEAIHAVEIKGTQVSATASKVPCITDRDICPNCKYKPIDDLSTAIVFINGIVACPKCHTLYFSFLASQQIQALLDSLGSKIVKPQIVMPGNIRRN